MHNTYKYMFNINVFNLKGFSIVLSFALAWLKYKLVSNLAPCLHA